MQIPHPASRALKVGTLSRSSWSEHVVAFVKIIYEAHFIDVLTSHGGLSRGTAESTVYEIVRLLSHLPFSFRSFFCPSHQATEVDRGLSPPACSVLRPS
jgi:hypothetical protein